MSLTLKQYYNKLTLSYSVVPRVLEIWYDGEVVCEVNGETIVYFNRKTINIIFMNNSPENILMNYYGKMRIKRIKAYDQQGLKINDVNFSIYSDDIGLLKSVWNLTDAKWEDFKSPSQKYSPISTDGVLKFNLKGISYYMNKKSRLMTENKLHKKYKGLLKRIRSDYE